MESIVDRESADCGYSIGGFILGILSFLVPLIGFILGIIGIIISAIALKERQRYRGLAIAGLVLNIVSVGSTVILLLIFGGVVFAFLGFTGGF